MSGEFQEFRETQGMPRITSIQPIRPTVHQDVIVPLFQAFVLALVVGLVVLAIVWGCFTMRFVVAGRWGLGIGGLAFMVMTVEFILEHRMAFMAPYRLPFAILDMLSPRRDRPEVNEEPWRTINPLPHKPQLLLPDQVMEHSVPSGTQPPQATEDIKEIFEFVVRVWPTGKCTRDHCKALGYDRAVWERLIGGKRGGNPNLASDRGQLDRAQAVRKDKAGTWQIISTVDEALSWNKALRGYRDAMYHYWDRTDGTGQDSDVVAKTLSGTERGGG